MKVVPWRDAVVHHLLAETWSLDGVTRTAGRVICTTLTGPDPSRRFIVLPFSMAVTLAISACSEQNEPKRPREPHRQ